MGVWYPSAMRIGLATLPPLPRVEAVRRIGEILREAADGGVNIVCFPETYVPGYRGLDMIVEPEDQSAQEQALEQIRADCRETGVAAIVGMEWENRLNIAMVVDGRGHVLGFQAKCQIAPSEDGTYTPGDRRKIFEIGELKFGIAICHEGWRYPETVRWAALRGAHIVFHPQFTGSDFQGKLPSVWGDPKNEYYEKAMIARAAENTVYFASVNFALRYPDSATSLLSPEGVCVAYQAYGTEGLLVGDLDLNAANGLLAKRLKPEVYG